MIALRSTRSCGNLRSGPGTQIEFFAREDGQGNLEAQFQYLFDPLRRRIASLQGAGASGEWALFASSEATVDLAHSSTGPFTLTKSYVRGATVDNVLMEYQPNLEATGHLFDAQGSVHFTVGPSGGINQQLSYSAWGESLISAGDQGRFSFTGREREDENGTLYYRARTLDASIGRFLQVDPAWVPMPSWTPYGYVGNAPLSHTDPSGMLLTTNVVSPDWAMRRVEIVADFPPSILLGAASIAEYASPLEAVATRMSEAQRHNGRMLVALGGYVTAGFLAEPGLGDAHSRGAFNMGVFTVGEGWIDFGHFFNNARGVYLGGEFALSITDALSDPGEQAETFALGNELFQEAARFRGLGLIGIVGAFAHGTAQSAFTIEDLNSNRLGREFGEWVMAQTGMLTSQDIRAALTNRLRSWGAVQGDSEHWRTARTFLLKEVRLLNRLYQAWDVDVGEAIASVFGIGPETMEEVQTEAVQELRSRLPPPRNYLPGAVETPATRVFGDPIRPGHPVSDYAWNPR